jgi:ureidoglycolate lyase
MQRQLIQLIARPISAQAFEPYGQLVEVGGRDGADMNDGRAQRYLQSTRLETRHAHPPELYLSDVSPSMGPLTLNYLERHPRSSQAFLPMRGGRFLVCVCLSDGRGDPLLDTLMAFVATAPQGVNYAMGTWHYPIVAIDTATLFSVLMWSEDGRGDFAGNCDIFKLAAPAQIDWTA